MIDVFGRCKEVARAYTEGSNTKHHELRKSLARDIPGFKYYLLNAGILSRIINVATKSIEQRDAERAQKHLAYAEQYAPADVVTDMAIRACAQRAGILFMSPDKRVLIWALQDWAKANRPEGMSVQTVIRMFTKAGVQQKKLPKKLPGPVRNDYK